MTKLRVMSYNVKRFVLNGESTLQPFVRELELLKPHIVCMNEVDVSLWPNLEEELRGALGNFMFYGHAKNGTYGNAIASTLPLRKVIECPLQGGTVVEYPPQSGKKHLIQRGLLVAQVDCSTLSLPSFAVATTHLDHIKETERELQLQHALEKLQGLAVPVVLCGDLNALKRSDYSETEWGRLEEWHAQNGWHPPTHGVLDLLEKRCFVDAFSHVHGVSLERLAPIEKFTASVNDPMYRIDYCFLDAAFREQFHVKRAWVHTQARHSDHFPLLVDFTPLQTSQL